MVSAFESVNVLLCTAIATLKADSSLPCLIEAVFTAPRSLPRFAKAALKGASSFWGLYIGVDAVSFLIQTPNPCEGGS